eukprot:GEMP01131129.1.p1 GENE.GEMP01131129.1~~GEMP01131129.1.p1  ORF type:complete len:111 (-),score=2.65 GEMP01131129.1:15-347(-)
MDRGCNISCMEIAYIYVVCVFCARMRAFFLSITKGDYVRSSPPKYAKQKKRILIYTLSIEFFVALEMSYFSNERSGVFEPAGAWKSVDLCGGPKWSPSCPYGSPPLRGAS